MTTAVKEILRTFETLTDAEKQAVTSELLRQVVVSEQGDLPDEGLILAAEELFLDLDTRERLNDQP